MHKYQLELSQEGASETKEIEAETLAGAEALAAKNLGSWLAAGDWETVTEQDGRVVADDLEVTGYWRLFEHGEPLAEDWRTVVVEADETHAIRLLTRATYGADASCGDDPDLHEWTSQGEGGLDENPGVWSTGGTSMTFDSHCRVCGLHRHELSRGFQRNPGEGPRSVTFRYLDPEQIEHHRRNGGMEDPEP